MVAKLCWTEECQIPLHILASCEEKVMIIAVLPLTLLLQQAKEWMDKKGPEEEEPTS
jgi:hypothetical protein